MACNDCPELNPNPNEGCLQPINSSCVTYDGNDINCAEITSGQTISQVIETLANNDCNLQDQIDDLKDDLQELSGVVQVIDNKIEELSGSQYSFSCSELSACSLDDLSDVDVEPLSGQSLIYNGTKWVNYTLEQKYQFSCQELSGCNIDSLGNVIESTPVSGQCLIYNGTNWVNSNIETGKTYSVQNGLNESPTEVFKLGGELTEDTLIDGDGYKMEVIDAKIHSVRSGGAASVGTAAKRESIHEVQNFNAPNGYAIHYDRTVSNIDAYPLTNGYAITNKSTSHLFVLKSNVTTAQLKNGSAVSNAIDFMQIDSSGGSYSLSQEQGSGTHTRRVVSNRRIQTFLHPIGLSTKATVGKFANLEVICTAQAYNNTFNEFIQVFVRSAKGTGSVQASGADMPLTYGIYQEDDEDINYFASEIFMLPNLPVYADNAAATSGGLPTGALYRTSTGDLKVRY